MLSQPDSQEKANEIEAEYHLRKYFECIGKPLIFSKKKIEDLHPKRKVERIANAKEVVTSIFKTMYGEDSTSVWKELLEAENQEPMLEKKRD